MRARVLGPGARPESADEIVLVAPDRATATKLRARRRTLRVLLAGDRLPFADGALDELVDERVTSAAAVEEDARVVREGGRVALVSDGESSGLLGALWKKPRRVIRTDASAWLLGAGCTDLEQHVSKDGSVTTEGRANYPSPRRGEGQG